LTKSTHNHSGIVVVVDGGTTPPPPPTVLLLLLLILLLLLTTPTLLLLRIVLIIVGVFFFRHTQGKNVNFEFESSFISNHQNTVKNVTIIHKTTESARQRGSRTRANRQGLATATVRLRGDAARLHTCVTVTCTRRNGRSHAAAASVAAERAATDVQPVHLDGRHARAASNTGLFNLVVDRRNADFLHYRHRLLSTSPLRIWPIRSNLRVCVVLLLLVLLYETYPKLRLALPLCVSVALSSKKKKKKKKKRIVSTHTLTTIEACCLVSTFALSRLITRYRSDGVMVEPLIGFFGGLYFARKARVSAID
jgi:hypothetical protein